MSELKIPEAQLDLPVSFSTSGEPVLLRELVTKAAQPSAVKSFPQLSIDQKARLTAERIKAQPVFDLVMVGAGHIDKERALLEIENRSEIGDLLMEVEGRTISRMLSRTERSDLT